MDTRDPAREEAERLLERLEAGPRPRMLLQLKNVESYASEALARVLIDRAVALRRTDHQGAFEYADAAVAVSGRLKGRRHAAVRARAQAEFANAWRNLKRFEDAAKALARAERELKAPEAEDEYAHVMLAKAALVRDLGRYDDATRYAHEAEIEFGYLDDTRNQTIALILLGQSYTLAKRFAPAQKVLNEAIGRMASEPWDPGLLVSASLNMVFNAAEHGSSLKSLPERHKTLSIALTMLGDAKPHIELHGTPQDRMQSRWAAARILTYLEYYDVAEARYSEIIEALDAAGETERGGFAILELCRVVCRLGRLSEAQSLAKSAVERFSAANLPEHLATALTCAAKATTLAGIESRVLHALKEFGAPKAGAPWVGISAC